MEGKVGECPAWMIGEEAVVAKIGVYPAHMIGFKYSSNRIPMLSIFVIDITISPNAPVYDQVNV